MEQRKYTYEITYLDLIHEYFTPRIHSFAMYLILQPKLSYGFLI